MIARVVCIALLCFPAYGKIRVWTLDSGKTVEGEYIKVVIENVVVKGADGNELKLPLKHLSKADRSYVQLENPPELNIDRLEHFRQDDPRTSIIWNDQSLVTCLYYTFGARIKQTDLTRYDHNLKVVVYILTQQVYDPDKYHIITKIQSKPFRLTKANRYKYEFRDKTEHRILKWVLGGVCPRGQKVAETIILVYDERGKIIAHHSSKKWLYKNLDKVEALPVGAWINRKCIRVHPTSPKRGT